jgi:hypothetical protein
MMGVDPKRALRPGRPCHLLWAAAHSMPDLVHGGAVNSHALKWRSALLQPLLGTLDHAVVTRPVV